MHCTKRRAYFKGTKDLRPQSCCPCFNVCNDKMRKNKQHLEIQKENLPPIKTHMAKCSENIARSESTFRVVTMIKYHQR